MRLCCKKSDEFIKGRIQNIERCQRAPREFAQEFNMTSVRSVVFVLH